MKGMCFVKRIFYVFLMAVVMAGFMAATAVPASAKPAKKTVTKAYKNYITRYRNKPVAGQVRYALADLNKDGVRECIVQYQNGMKCRIIILTYRNKKVKKVFDASGMEEIYYNKKKNRICIDYGYGAIDHMTAIYRFTGKRLKRTDYYESKSLSGGGVRYTHKKKVISETAFYDTLSKINATWKNVSPFSTGKVIG